MDKYWIRCTIKEDMLEKLCFSDSGDNLDLIIEKLEGLLQFYKSKRK